MSDRPDSKLDLGTLISVQTIVLVLALVGMDITETAANNEVPLFAALAFGIGAGILSYAPGLIIVKLPIPGRNALRAGLEKMLSVLGDLSYLKIIIISAGAAISEEFFCRVFLQGWLSDLVSPGVGILVGAFVFGLLHGVSVAYVIATFVMGLAIGVVYEWTGSAAMVIAWHFIYDVVALVVATRRPQWIGVQEAGDQA